MLLLLLLLLLVVLAITTFLLYRGSQLTFALFLNKRRKQVRDVDVALVGKDTVTVELLRDGQQMTVTAETFDPMQNLPVALDRVALWAGAVLQEVPQMAQWMWNSSPDGVFISAVVGVNAQRSSYRERARGHCWSLCLNPPGGEGRGHKHTAIVGLATRTHTHTCSAVLGYIVDVCPNIDMAVYVRRPRDHQVRCTV